MIAANARLHAQHADEALDDERARRQQNDGEGELRNRQPRSRSRVPLPMARTPPSRSATCGLRGDDRSAGTRPNSTAAMPESPIDAISTPTLNSGGRFANTSGPRAASILIVRGGDRDADPASGDGNDETFSEQLSDQPASPRAERGANRHLAATADPARQQEIRHVGAGDEQHEERRAEQQIQWTSQLADGSVVERIDDHRLALVVAGIRHGELRRELRHLRLRPRDGHAAAEQRVHLLRSSAAPVGRVVGDVAPQRPIQRRARRIPAAARRSRGPARG